MSNTLTTNSAKQAIPRLMAFRPRLAYKLPNGRCIDDLVKQGLLPWVFDLAAPGAGSPSPRIWNISVYEYCQGIPKVNSQGKDIEAVINSILPPDNQEPTASEVANAFGSSCDLLTTFQRHSLIVAVGSGQRRHTKRFSRESLVNFLKGRLLQ
jgi:hypothetical protein